MDHIYLIGFLQGKITQLDEVIEYLEQRRAEFPHEQVIQLEVDRSMARVLAHKREVERNLVQIPMSN